MAENVKTVQGLAIASVKTLQGLAIASAKTVMGVDNTGGGGISVISESAGSANSNTAVTSAMDTTGCDFIAVMVGFATGVGAATVTDSKSNTWNSYTAGTGSVVTGQIFYCFPSSVGSGHTFTVTTSAGSPSISVAAFTASGVTVSDQQSADIADATSTVQPQSITPSADNALVITGVASFQGTTSTVNGGFAEVEDLPFSPGNYFGSTLAWELQTTAAAVNPTWTNAGTWSGVAACIGSFKP